MCRHFARRFDVRWSEGVAEAGVGAVWRFSVLEMTSTRTFFVDRYALASCGLRIYY